MKNNKITLVNEVKSERVGSAIFTVFEKVEEGGFQFTIGSMEGRSTKVFDFETKSEALSYYEEALSFVK